MPGVGRSTPPTVPLLQPCTTRFRATSHAAVCFKNEQCWCRHLHVACSAAWCEMSERLHMATRHGRDDKSNHSREVLPAPEADRVALVTKTQTEAVSTLHLRSNATTWAAGESTVPVLQSCSFHLCHSCRVCRLNFFDSEA